MPPRYIQIGEADHHFQLVTSSQICFANCSQCHLQFWLVNWRSYWGMGLQVYTPILWELNTKNDQIWERYVVPKKSWPSHTLRPWEIPKNAQLHRAGQLVGWAPRARRIAEWSEGMAHGNSRPCWEVGMVESKIWDFHNLGNGSPKQIFYDFLTTKTSWSDHYFNWIPLDSTFHSFLGITMYYKGFNHEHLGDKFY